MLHREFHALTNQRSCTEPNRGPSRLLLLDKEAMQLEVELRWLEMAEVRLDEIRRQPLPEPDVRRLGRPKRGTTLERETPKT